jgi:hypothetical protein
VRKAVEREVTSREGLWRRAGFRDGRTDEGKVEHLEKPRRDFGAEDGPAVVLVGATKK